mmetsp:Transcript_65636/g.203367  ORF Transcript_65636/g.203367 Transcript_65636/m.203367 type:complete len:215 (+) Transcript_65636:751-1395(+)
MLEPRVLVQRRLRVEAGRLQAEKTLPAHKGEPLWLPPERRALPVADGLRALQLPAAQHSEVASLVLLGGRPAERVVLDLLRLKHALLRLRRDPDERQGPGAGGHRHLQHLGPGLGQGEDGDVRGGRGVHRLWRRGDRRKEHVAVALDPRAPLCHDGVAIGGARRPRRVRVLVLRGGARGPVPRGLEAHQHHDDGEEPLGRDLPRRGRLPGAVDA